MPGVYGLTTTAVVVRCGAPAVVVRCDAPAVVVRCDAPAVRKYNIVMAHLLV